MQLGTESSSREALQLLLALGLGAIVGLERRLRGHPAGIHTNALWCTSAMGVLAAVNRPLLAGMVACATLATNIALHYVEHALIKMTAENSRVE
jgi:uncharacterized membrane protein YhiD involved in acid resistance